MKRVIALLLVTLALSAATAAPGANYRLYYLDKTRNVSSVDIIAGKVLAQQPRRLSSAGGYDGYSVSPDENLVFGWKQIGLQYEQFGLFKCFLEKSGKPQGRILGIQSTEYSPSADWSPQCKHLIVRIPGQVEMGTIVYSLERRKLVIDTTDLLPDFCSDQAYSFVLEDVGDLDNSPAWLRILDMRTGKMTKLAQVNNGVYGDGAHYVWFGKSHRFAFIDFKGNVIAGEVSRGRSEPAVKKWALTNNGNCDDLRYVPGRGIYFIQEIGKTTTAYHCGNLRALKGTETLPVQRYENAPRNVYEGKAYSPDNLLYAAVETGKPGEVGTIKVYDKSGRYLGSVKGTRPRWRGGEQ